ncbi:hypothetical protein IQ266_27530 [filamentous cyanobacterium LEGE 11480]|uniref:Uncharacterized protein n=1 Tax=Romeriopsis navalis LEGE 11480 TaxID=2777977 RepID=A0A928VRU8_9CYAN|nr:hypothetical protein [Romeriopsis navalis]MBE9033486.1 hypothetical protein [Romeriopsis navalis LEGE 11480]
MNLINLIDSTMGVIDFVEAMIRFSQREAVRHQVKRSIAIGHSILLSLGLLAIIVLCFVIVAVQAIYRQWREILPVAIATFKEGYYNKTVSDISMTVIELTTATPTKAKTKTQYLREACTAAGIQWRNIRGKNKHATIVQMQQLLNQQQTS